MAWLTGWAKRIEITVNDTYIDDNLTHFPLTLKLGSSVGVNSADLTPIFDEVGSNSQKIAVTKSDGETQIYVEIEKWDSGSETAILHVSKSDLTINASGGATLYIYYDNTQSNNTTYVGTVGNRTEVWDSNFEVVYHLADANGSTTIVDSTSNNNDGNRSSTTDPTKVTSLIGDAQNFGGATDESILSPNIAFNTNDLTFEVTFKAGQNRSLIRTIFGFRDSSNSYGGGLFINTSGNISSYMKPNNNTVASASTYDDNSQHYSVVTVDYDGNFELWVDATSIGSAVRGVQDYGSSHDIHIGDGENSATSWKEFIGDIDEFRLSLVLRSDAYIKATQYSLSDQLLSYGTEELSSSTVSVDLLDVTFTSGATDVTKTFTLKTRIQKSNEKTTTFKSRIKSLGFTKTFNIKARLLTTVSKSIQSKSRIKIINIPKVIQSKGSVKKLDVIKTLQSKSRVKQTLNKTITIKARILDTGVTKTTDSKARLLKALTKQVTIKSRLLKVISKTFTSKSRILRVNTKTITSKAKIKLLLGSEIDSKARILVKYSKTLTSKTRVLTGGITKQIQVIGRVLVTVDKQITTKSRIKVTQNVKTINVKSRIQSNINKGISSKTRIKVNSIKTFLSKTRVLDTGITKTITSSARIKHLGLLKTFTNKANIKNTSHKNISSLSRVKKSFSKNVFPKARVKRLRVKTTQLKAIIQVTTSKNVSFKARIINLSQKTFTAKSRLKDLGLTKSLDLKARIQQFNTKTLTIKSRIRITNQKMVLCKTNIIKGDFHKPIRGIKIITRTNIQDIYTEQDNNKSNETLFTKSTKER